MSEESHLCAYIDDSGEVKYSRPTFDIDALFREMKAGSLHIPAAESDKLCHACHKVSKQRCSICKKVRYCSVECQKKDWKVHKTVCKKE